MFSINLHLGGSRRLQNTPMGCGSIKCGRSEGGAAFTGTNKFKLLVGVLSTTEDSSLRVTDDVIPAMPEGPDTVAQLRSAAPPRPPGSQ